MPYHHGNARSALLEAAARLLEEEGAARLSLRQVAEGAGLSRQAPYNHFPDKESLLAELVRYGFERLGSNIGIGIGIEGVAPLEKLTAAAEAYIAFGQNEPALFRLMFSREIVDLRKFKLAQRAASEVLDLLSEIVGAVAPGCDRGDASLTAWSLVHGYTSLCIETELEGAEARRRRAELFAHTVKALSGP